jgi:hypothetical protein
MPITASCPLSMEFLCPRQWRELLSGIGWDDIAILYRNNFMSRGYEEALMRARIPYVIVDDIGFYQRAEIKDAAFLRLSATPDDRQSDEAFRRVINEPRRGYGAKAMEILEAEASFRNVSLLSALDTAALPPRAALPDWSSRVQSGGLAPTLRTPSRINSRFFSTRRATGVFSKVTTGPALRPRGRQTKHEKSCRMRIRRRKGPPPRRPRTPLLRQPRGGEGGDVKDDEKTQESAMR